jgi:hypothetical protein
LGLVGEPGPEAVLPLPSGFADGSAGLNLTVNFGSITLGTDATDPKVLFREFAGTIAYEVQQAELCAVHIHRKRTAQARYS